MINYVRIPTSAEVYAVVMARHRDDMVAYGSFSDPDGTFNGGPGEVGRMDTMWALRDTDFPILEINTRWDIEPGGIQRRNQTSDYWLIVGKDES